MAFSGIEEASILVTDIEDIKQVLSACIVYFTAQDVSRAQMAFGKMRKSPLTGELERVNERVNGILGDYLLQRYEEETSITERSDDPEPEEEFSSEPLGGFVAPRQKGRILVPQTADVQDPELDYEEAIDEATYE